MDDKPLFDLSELNFDEFVSFFFDHDTKAEEYWYQDRSLSSWNDFDEETMRSPQVIVGHMTRLFTNFTDIASEFSLEQINAGIWAMFTNQPFRLQKHLWLLATPLPERLDCIHSMYSVYSDYVAKSKVEVMENCFYMWWDWVAGNFWEQLRITDNISKGDVASLSQEQKTLLPCCRLCREPWRYPTCERSVTLCTGSAIYITRMSGTSCRDTWPNTDTICRLMQSTG
jgi:hypothetical protein